MTRFAQHVLPLSPYFSEFLGTFFIVFVTALLLSSQDGVNEMWRPSGIAFATMAAMSATSFVSGSHLNPAVSLAFGMTRKMPFRRTVKYMITQVVAGITACEVVRLMTSKPLPLIQPQSGYTLIDAALVEGLYSGTYCFVALNCISSLQNNPKGMRNQFFALAVSFVVIAGGHPANEVSGAFLNPAISAGFVLCTHTRESLGRSLLIVAAQVTGSFLAAILFFLVRPEELAALGVNVDGHGCNRLCSAIHAVNVCGKRKDGTSVEDGDSDDEVGAVEDVVSQVEASVKQQYTPSLPARVMSEFVGTYFIVLTFGLCAVSTNRALAEKPKGASLLSIWSEVDVDAGPVANFASTRHGGTGRDVVSTPYSTGAALLAMTYSLGTVSGAHFNPAVTLAVMCSSRDPYVWAEAPTRILTQAGAALLAALTYIFICKGQAEAVPNYLPHLGPGQGFSWMSVTVGEMIFTTALAYVVLCMATVDSPRYPKASTAKSFDFGLAIGFIFMAGAWVMQRISGGMLNPAISLSVSASGIINMGLAAFTPQQLSTFSGELLQYVCWQCAGGILASFIFWLVHPLLYKPDPLLAK